MSINENNEKMIIEMNELFDELIEDAVNFSKDIMMGINMMPFAIGFFVLVTVGYAYYIFILFPSNLIGNILNVGMVALLIYVIYILIMKYYELKKKYSTLFDIKEKLDKLEEF
jgi:hypothetical protein